jgi:hypothetical protein
MKNVALGALLALSLGCEAKGGDAPDLAAPADLRPEALDLSGTWAMKLTNAQQFEHMILGKSDVTLTSLRLLTLVQAQGGREVSSKGRVCALSLTPFAGNQTTYPDAAIAAMPEESAMVALGGEAAVGVSYKPQRQVLLLGWRARGDAATEALPTDPKDDRVIDADKDQNPGVTLMLETLIGPGEAYAVSRDILTLEGKIEGRDRIAGTSRTEQAQVVLAARPAALKSDVKATPDPDNKKSPFVMVRVPSGSDCAYVKAKKDTIF